MFCLRSSFKSIVVLSIVVLLFCLPLLLASGQDSKTGDQDLSGVWDQFTGEWVRYADDWILTKNITRGQEVFTRQNQYGTPDFEYVNPMKIENSNGIYLFTKLDPDTQKPIYQGGFKLSSPNGAAAQPSAGTTSAPWARNGLFYEMSAGILADHEGKPQVWEFRRSDDPVFQLHQACRDGNVDKIKVLLDGGLDVDSMMWDSYTPLAYAAAGGHIDAVNLLLDSGAEINQQGRFGKTALNHAIGGGNQDVCALLIQRGAQLDIPNQNGANLFHEAAFWGQPAMIPFLIEKKIDLHHASKAGDSPLMYAIARASRAEDTEKQATFLRCAQAFVEAGADPDQKNNKGDTPRSYAEASEFAPVKDFFK